MTLKQLAAMMEGKKVVRVREATPEESRRNFLPESDQDQVVIEVEGGAKLAVMGDQEGNGPGWLLEIA